MENKKGELSITMIILVVIGLVILAVMIYLVIDNTRGYEDATACSKLGGYCKEDVGDCSQITVPSGDPCVKQNKRCCVIGS